MTITMKLTRWSLGALFLLASPLAALGQPSVSGAGTFAHGQQVVIDGSAFGTKVPAAPALWIDGEDKSASTAADTADGWSSVRSNTWFYEQQLAGVGQAHGRSSIYLSGQHNPTCGGQACNNIEIGFHAGSPSNTWFIFYYLRLHPDWGAPPTGYCDDKGGIDRNYKEMWQHEPCSMITGPIVTSYYGGDEAFSSAEPWHFGSSSGDLCGSQINDEAFGGNPSQRWNHRMWVLRRDPGYLKVGNYSDHPASPSAFIERACAQPLFETHAADRDEICHMDFGAYARYCADNSTFPNMRRYMDDIYIDTTWARVLLGDASDPDACTVLEPQPPSSWSDSSITVTANLGRLGGNAAYLFVYDAAGNVNPAGYPVSIGGGVVDAGGPDLSTADAASTDAATRDAAVQDAAARDVAPWDTVRDAPRSDSHRADGPSKDTTVGQADQSADSSGPRKGAVDEGCRCRVSGPVPSAGHLLLLSLLLIPLIRRRSGPHRDSPPKDALTDDGSKNPQPRPHR